MPATAPSVEPTKVLDPAPLDLPPVLDRYQIQGIIGEGGMGTVFKAFHLALKRHVAIKTLREDRISTPEIVTRFRQEIAVVGQMDHPNVVRASDAGEKNGVFYLVMDFLAGCDLGTLVAKKGPLDLPQACELIRQAALGLDYIHQTLVHRDIKPSNLMLTTGGLVKVLDLGLARSDMPDAIDSELTPRGVPVGTYSYMAPEQTGGSRKLDGRADIYSLGCTLFKLLTGKAPYSGPQYDNAALQLQAHCNVPLTAVEGFALVPAEIRPVLLRMVAKDPKDRYATGRAVAEALAPFAGSCVMVPVDTALEAVVRPLPSPAPSELSRLTVSLVDTPRETPEHSATSVLPRRNWKWPILALLAVTLGLPTVLWMTFVAPHRGEVIPPPPPVAAGLRDLDELTPHKRHDLLDRLPLAIGFDKPDPDRWQLNPQTGTLDLKGAAKPLFLPLGKTARSRYTVEIGIRQAPWTGRVGFFWGYREKETGQKNKAGNVEFARFHVLLVNLDSGSKDRPDQYSVERGTYSLFRDSRGEIQTRQDTVVKHDVPWLGVGEKVLEVHMHENGPTQVTFASTQLTRLVSLPINRQLQSLPGEGSLGVFSIGSDASVNKVSFTPK